MTLVALAATPALLSAIGIWSVRTAVAGSSSMPSIAVDALGGAHILAPWNELRYYTTAGGRWAEYVLPETSFVFHGSIAIDRENRLHVAYAAAEVVDDRIVSNTTLKYATNRDGDWRIEVVDTEGATPYQTSEAIAVDSTGVPHISYSTATFDGLYNLTRKYASNSGGTWTIRPLELFPYGIWWYGGHHTGIAVDAQGSVHIAYPFDSSNVGYATNETGSWAFSYITNEGSSDMSAPIAVDSRGRVHVAYYGNDNRIVHAFRDGAEWRFETIDRSGQLGPRTISLAMDAADRVHVAFTDRDVELVKYVTNSGGAWRSSTVDGGPVAWVSTAVGPDARPRLVYNEESTVKYATTSVDPGILPDFVLATMPYLILEAGVAVATALGFRWASHRPRPVPPSELDP